MKQPVRAGCDGLEYRLHVRRRTGDHLQDVGGGGLPFQRLLGLVEQPRVFDGDHGLIGEGLQQLDLVGCKRSGLTARYGNHADWLAITEHGY